MRAAKKKRRRENYKAKMRMAKEQHRSGNSYTNSIDN